MAGKAKYWVVAVIAAGVLILVATVAIQIRASSLARDREAKRQAAPPTLLTTIKPAGSLNALRAATARAPDDAAAWSRLGDALLVAHDLPGATQAYRRAVELDETRWQDWSALGETYVQTAQSQGGRMPAAARDAFGRALRLHPTDMRAQFYQAMEQDFTGGHDAAITAWMTMLEQVPMGSQADGAIRGAIIASVARHALNVRNRMAAATIAQKALKPATP